MEKNFLPIGAWIVRLGRSSNDRNGGYKGQIIEVNTETMRYRVKWTHSPWNRPVTMPRTWVACKITAPCDPVIDEKQ